MLHVAYTINSLDKPRTARRTGLSLIYRFPLSLLLFYNHNSLPVHIRGNHLLTLLILP